MVARSPHLIIVRRLLFTQLAIVLFLPLAFLPLGINAALSTVAGGLASFIPNAYFAYRTFQYRGARAANAIARSMFAGQVGKFVLMALIFLTLFKYQKTLNHEALFSGFIVVQLSVWLTPLLANLKPNSSFRK